MISDLHFVTKRVSIGGFVCFNASDPAAGLRIKKHKDGIKYLMNFKTYGPPFITALKLNLHIKTIMAAVKRRANQKRSNWYDFKVKPTLHFYQLFFSSTLLT